MKQYNNVTIKKGFTLIETIIYMGLLAVILLIVTNLLIASSSFSQEETARLEIQKNGRFAVERIIRDLQASQTISIPSDSIPTGNLVISNPEQITYNISNNRLVRVDSTSTENVTDNQVKIDSLSFSRIENPGGNTTIKIDLTVNYIGQVEGNRNISQEFSTTYSLK